jgi:hypothetical protein
MKNPETLATLTYKTQNGEKLNERPIMNEESRDIGNIMSLDSSFMIGLSLSLSPFCVLYVNVANVSGFFIHDWPFVEFVSHLNCYNHIRGMQINIRENRKANHE